MTPSPKRTRDDFSERTKRDLARSVNYNCSKCGAPTAAPFSGGGKSITTGEAAHIRAAAPGGPRYDATMTPAQRSAYDNGIWLCAAHGPLVDRDFPRYSADDLHEIKKLAEAKALRNLEEAKRIADQRPVLDGTIEWREANPNETREGYQGLVHAAFTLGGKWKQRGRSYIELAKDGAGTPHRINGCIAEGTGRLANEFPALRPGEPYVVPVFAVIKKPSKFWLDRRFIPDHPFFEPDRVMPILAAGVYLTDEPFLNKVHRAALAPGLYKVRMVLILGDAENSETFYSEWRDLSVA